MNKSNKFYKKKPDDYKCVYATQILNIIEISQCANGKMKSVFEVGTRDKTRRCVYWGTLRANIGDKVRMKGFLNRSDIFIAESMLIDTVTSKETK